MHPQHSTRTVEDSLARPQIHEGWEAAYRTPEHERVADAVFTRLVAEVGAPDGSQWVDVGCGPGIHAIRLARAGYRVNGLDLSEGVLAAAQENARTAGVADRVTFNHGNLLALPFADSEISYLLCWGVLMHVPDIAGAVREMSRVLAPGGRIAIQENNRAALDNKLLTAFDALRPSRARRVDTAAGLERWFETPGGTLLTRQTDIAWLTRTFEDHGLTLVERISGPLTETYTKMGSGLLARATHRLNELWVRRIARPGPAQSNVLIFERSGH